MTRSNIKIIKDIALIFKKYTEKTKLKNIMSIISKFISIKLLTILNIISIKVKSIYFIIYFKINFKSNQVY